MFKKILFPTDFSGPATTELHCITSIPGIQEIILLHVVKQYAIPMGVELVEGLELQTAEIYLQEAETFIKSLNPDIRVTLEETIASDVAGAILEAAEKNHADLIVIHAHIKTIMTGLFLGRVPSTVLCRNSNVNVMIMPDKLVEALVGKTFDKFCPMIFSRILCPVRFSEFSVNVAVLAGTMKSVGEIILLHVVNNDGREGDPGEAVKTAEVRIEAISDNLSAHGIKSRTIVTTGKPEQEIPRVAHEEDVSLVWMRSASQGCLHDFFFGSTAHDVVMNATRPVMIIRSYQ